MARRFVFADEAGCFNFSRNPKASRYYILCTLTCDACDDLGSSLLDLRRRLIWDKYPIGEYFHASEDKQVVRDEVFGLLQKKSFTIQATIFEKSKAYPRIRPTNHMFYQYAWFYHFKHVAPKIAKAKDELHITAASVGTHKGQVHFSNAVESVVRQIAITNVTRTNFCRSVADPCLQAVDYCTWAIQKKWETGNILSYNLIKNRVTHEVDSWSHGTTHHY
jgi:hypothetical protein